MVEDIPAIRISSADVWVPYTTSLSDLSKTDYGGPYAAMLLAKNTDDIAAIKKEFYKTVATIPLPPSNRRTTDAQYTILKLFADSRTEAIVRDTNGSTDNYISVPVFYSFIRGYVE